MHVYVAWRVENLDNILSTAFQVDNAPELKRISQSLNKGIDDVKAWAIGVGGMPVLMLATLGCIEVPAEKMVELPSIKKRFDELTGHALCIGVGMDLSEAYRALMAAARTEDRIALYTEEMDTPEEEVTDPNDDGLAGLVKADGPSPQPQQDESPPAEQQPPAEQDSAPAAPTPTAASPAASAGPAPGPVPEGDPQQQEDSAPQNPRDAIIAALKEVKEAAPILERLKRESPDAYRAVHDVVQAMIMMAEGMMGQEGEETQKSEDDSKAAPPGFTVEAMQKLKAKYGNESAHKLAWAVYRRKGRETSSTEGLEKEGPMPHQTPKRITMKYPNVPAAVGATGGTIKDGKIKAHPINPEDGSPRGEDWNGARAGLIMGPKGSPVSSREPNDE